MLPLLEIERTVAASGLAGIRPPALGPSGLFPLALLFAFSVVLLLVVSRLLREGESVDPTSGFLALPRRSEPPGSGSPPEVAPPSRETPLAGVIAALMNLIHVGDPSLHAHVERQGDVARRMAERMGLSPGEAEEVAWAASLHDIGKLTLDRQLLAAPRPLTPEEWKVVRQHPDRGARILESVPGLERVAVYVRHHHERWDGGGYPDGLRGKQIPIGARIINLIDSFDAMIAPRPYQMPRSLMDAVAEVRKMGGSQFDPAVVEAFLDEMESLGLTVRER